MSSSWTSTLKLPKSTFPSRPAAQLREEYLRRCTGAFYEWQAANRPADKQFVLHDGPPYANGSLHVGHALNKILKDIIIRSKVQQGYRVKYVPGWDCHGLPIELKALWEVAERKDLSPVKIRSRAADLAARTVGQQMQQFKSYAVMADWEGRWTTMDPSYEIRQLELFRKLVRRGLIYRKNKPVYWSPSSRTALAEAELEYNEEHVSTAAYVRLPIAVSSQDDPSALRNFLGGDFNGQLYALIWTTTPWTLPANKAIAVHNDVDYSIVRQGEDALVIATQCLESVNKACFGGVPGSLLKTCKGTELRRFVYKVPHLRGSKSLPQPIIHADFVSADSGSGLVHVAPGHGFEDYEVCQPLNLGTDVAVDGDGNFTEEACPDDPQLLRGHNVLTDGSKRVLEILGRDVVHVHPYRHKYPYDWRTKKPVVIRATSQWFADVGSIKADAMRALQDVHFIPAAGQKRLESFVQGRSEWCISRQRAWGVPIPALYSDDVKDGDAVMTDESVKHIIGVIKERGTDAWWSDDRHDPAWIPSWLQGKGTFLRGRDTMDVWFDSGSSWTQEEGGARADVYLEGTDQHRGWFQSSLLTRVAAAATTSEGSLVDQTVGLAPFKHLITHGFTLDKDGKKMSKSLGNVLTPEQVMDGSLLPPIKRKKKGPADPNAPVHYDALGPDALRLWASSSDYTRDVVIGETVLRSVHTALIKYRTTIKMLLGSMHESARQAPLTATDRIAMILLQDVMKEVGEANKKFEFYKAFGSLNRWVSNGLSAFYLEAMKDRLYCGDGGGVLEPVFMGLMRMLAPVTPMLVEEAWDHRPSWLKTDASVVHPLQQLYASPIIDASRLAGSEWDEARLREAIPTLMAAHAGIKAASELARAAKALGSSLQCTVVLEVPDEGAAQVLKQFGSSELESMFVVSSLEVKSRFSAPEDAEWAFSEKFAVVAPGSRSGDGAAGTGSPAECTAWVLPPTQSKCPRCWRYVAPEEGTLCRRCEDVVSSLEMQ